MVTVELAVGVLVSSLMLMICCAVLGLVILQDRCASVAHQIAREVSRGDQAGAVMARALLPRGSTVVVRTDSGWITVVVSTERRWGALGPVRLSGTAMAPLEPGEPGS